MGVRIQELPETTGINKEDLLIVEDGQGTKKGTVQQLDEALWVSQLKEDLGEYDSKLRSLVEVDATEVVANKLINLKSKEEYDLMGGCYIKQNIPSSVRKIKVSGRSASAENGYSLGAFYKADGTCISTFGDDNDTRYTDLQVDVPDGTSFIYVNQGQIASEKYEKVKFFVVFDVLKKSGRNSR